MKLVASLNWGFLIKANILERLAEEVFAARHFHNSLQKFNNIAKILTVKIETLSKMTLSIMTFSKMTLCIASFIVRLNVMDYIYCVHSLNVIIINVAMLSVVALFYDSGFSL